MVNKEPGYVYILTNPSFREDWVKIGKSSRPVDVRSKELDNTAVPLPFEIFATMKTVKYNEVEKMLKIRLGEHKGDPKFKKFADKLDELRERMEQNLISSIDFLKQLLQMARELLEAKKEIEQPLDKRAQARAALTDLFQSIKSEETPIIVEQVVNDIDNEVVNIIRQFNDAFQSVTARREIKKKLRSILWIKYQIKDNDVFEKAYSYIEMYY